MFAVNGGGALTEWFFCKFYSMHRINFSMRFWKEKNTPVLKQAQRNSLQKFGFQLAMLFHGSIQLNELQSLHIPWTMACVVWHKNLHKPVEIDWYMAQVFCVIHKRKNVYITQNQSQVRSQGEKRLRLIHKLTCVIFKQKYSTPLTMLDDPRSRLTTHFCKWKAPRPNVGQPEGNIPPLGSTPCLNTLFILLTMRCLVSSFRATIFRRSCDESFLSWGVWSFTCLYGLGESRGIVNFAARMFKRVQLLLDTPKLNVLDIHR